MPVCPQCGYEYEPTVTECPECHVMLQDQTVSAPEPPTIEWTVIYRPADEWEAAALRDLLESAGIPAVLRSLQIAAYGEIAEVQEGAWGEILVPIEQMEAARQLIESLLEEARQPSEETPEEEKEV